MVFTILVITLQDSLLSLALMYLTFSVGTEQYVRRDNGSSHYVLAFTLATYLFLLAAAVGVRAYRRIETSVLKQAGSALQKGTRL